MYQNSEKHLNLASEVGKNKCIALVTQLVSAVLFLAKLPALVFCFFLKELYYYFVLTIYKDIYTN